MRLDEQLLAFGLGGDVAGDRGSVAAGVFDAVNRSLERAGQHLVLTFMHSACGADDARAFLREEFRDRLSNPAAGAGHDCYFLIELAHL